MKRLLFLFLIPTLVTAQNLVPNGSFEWIQKPVKSRFPGNIEKAAPWFPAGVGSPDLIIPPDKVNGVQTAAQGANYAGIILYDADNKNFREYLEVKLTQTLEAGKEYCLRFKVSAGDDSWSYTDELGVHLSADSVRSNDWNLINLNPTFKTRKYETLADTANWISIEFSFIAKGQERFLTFGNFRDDASTLLRSGKKEAWLFLAYLYIDDVYLGPCAVDTLPTTGSPVITPEFNAPQTGNNGPPIIPNLLTPNNDGFNDVFIITNLKKYCSLIIQNKAGETVYKTSNYQNDFTGENLPDGKYSYELKMPEGNLIFGSFDLFRKKK